MRFHGAASHSGVVLVAVVTLGVLALVGCGGGDGGGAGGAGVGVATATGVIRDDGSLVGIPAATVQIEQRDALTGGDGSFFIANLPAGNRTLVAAAQGYQAISAAVTLFLGDNNIGDFYLPPQLLPGRGAVTGAARSAGAAVSRAQILIGGVSGLSKPDGVFTVYNVPTGLYTLSATAPTGQAGSATVPGVQIQAGQTTDVGTLELSAGPPGPPVFP